MYDYGNDYGTTSSLLGGFAAMFGIMSIVSLVIGIIMLVSQWKIYKKAGKKGWESLIPIYNIIVLLQIVELPTWYIILFIVPIANIYVMFKMYIELAHKFGKSTGFGVATVFFSIICLPILAFGKNNVYGGSGQPTTNNMQTPQNNPTPPVAFQNENNNMVNNNMTNNNSNTQAPFMFDQNINTEINRIPEANMDNNLNSKVNPMPQPEMNQTPAFNPTAPNVTSQPGLNVVPNMTPSPQPVNSMDNQVNPMPGVVQQPENTFKYEAPTSVVTPTPEPSPQPGIVNSTPIEQPTSPTTPVNVIPGMGTMPQPVMNNQNVGNNQNNQSM